MLLSRVTDNVMSYLMEPVKVLVWTIAMLQEIFVKILVSKVSAVLDIRKPSALFRLSINLTKSYISMRRTSYFKLIVNSSIADLINKVKATRCCCASNNYKSSLPSK